MNEQDELDKEYDAEFAKLEQQVRSKMEQAGKLISEARLLVDGAVTEHLLVGTNPFDANDEGALDLYLGASELRDATSPLTEAMDEAGWSTSSLYC